MNRNEGTFFVGNMIPGVTFESIRDHPTVAYSKAVEELVKERVSFKSDFLLFCNMPGETSLLIQICALHLFLAGFK